MLSAPFRARRIATAALTAGYVVAPGRATAQEQVVWSVAIESDCGARERELVREVNLACDAVAGECRVARGRGAERRAVVACPTDARWTLEAQSAGGVHLWTVALDGAPEGRLRTAAMWIARAERDAPPVDAPVIALAPPPPAPAASPARDASPSPPAARPVAPAALSAAPSLPLAIDAETRSADPPRDRGPAIPRLASSARRGGLAVSARGSIAGGLAPSAIGASARAALGLPARANAGFVVSADRALGVASGYGLSTARAGATLGWGAPWSAEDLLGASIEAGPVVGLLDAPPGVTPGSRGFVDAYAQLTLYGRVREVGALRPWIAVGLAALAAPLQVSVGALPVASQPRVSGTVDVGVAWAGW